MCLNSSGAPVGQIGYSRPFTIAAGDLVLLNPGRAFRAANDGTVRVAWKTSASVGNVNIFIKSGSRAETLVASNVSGTFRDIVLPAAVSSSSQVTIRIEDAGNSSRQDSVDGYFMVRGGSPVFTATSVRAVPCSPVRFKRSSGREPRPRSPLTSTSIRAHVLVRSIARNLPDFGRYTWFVPDMLSPSSRIHATFKDAGGIVLGQADTSIFRILARKPAIGDFDGDGTSDLTIYRPSDGGYCTPNALRKVRVSAMPAPASSNGDCPRTFL